MIFSALKISWLNFDERHEQLLVVPYDEIDNVEKIIKIAYPHARFIVVTRIYANDSD